MLSKNFYQSPACLNEMGAAWVKQSNYFSVLLPSFKHKEMKGVINLNEQTLDLCDPVRLTELSNTFRQVWTQLPIENKRWTSLQYKFVEDMKKIYGTTKEGE